MLKTELARTEVSLFSYELSGTEVKPGLWAGRNVQGLQFQLERLNIPRRRPFPKLEANLLLSLCSIGICYLQAWIPRQRCWLSAGSVLQSPWRDPQWRECQKNTAARESPRKPEAGTLPGFCKLSHLPENKFSQWLLLNHTRDILQTKSSLGSSSDPWPSADHAAGSPALDFMKRSGESSGKETFLEEWGRAPPILPTEPRKWGLCWVRLHRWERGFHIHFAWSIRRNWQGLGHRVGRTAFGYFKSHLPTA